MQQEEIVQGNLYQNKHDKSLVVIATKQEVSNRNSFCGVNLSTGEYDYDWQLYQFEHFPINSKDLIKENLSLKERIMELVQKNIDQQREYDQRFCDMFDQEQVKCNTKLAEIENKIRKGFSNIHQIDSSKIKRLEQELSITNLALLGQKTICRNQSAFIQHLQDYIAAKHLEENGLILEKFIQEESDAKKSS
jgi:hypothetical protein